MNYSNTNEHLYDDIALWEKTDGKELFTQMPLAEKKTPKILDFGYGFGENLFAVNNAYPEGMVYGIDCSPVCQNEVGEKITARGLKNICLINKEVHDLGDFENASLDLVLLYDALHGGDGKGKYMLFEESYRVLKAGGCLSILPVHLSNWRDHEGKKKTYSLKMIIDEVQSFGFEYAGTCGQKGVHWEKCHTMYYIKKGNITFDVLEKVDVMNFLKK
ncbi:MAG: class I SAM-dependent methyltransferase [Treponema sp.]|nr:class I SAM-dependent methyltransferase [Treponema sp.]